MRMARLTIRPGAVPTGPRIARLRVPAAVLALAVVAVVAVTAVAFGHRTVAVRRESRFLTMPRTPGSEATVRIDTSFFTPADGGRHPAVLLAHGFGGSKDDMTGQAEQLARHGYAVLTWSARGFGRSSGAIGLDAPDREVADARRLVDWLGHRRDVLQDGPDDPRVGVAGASYGGALALLAAGYDRRIDAIAPQITWWNLPQALFPQNALGEPAGSGVFKKLWAGIFFTTGSADPSGAGATGVPPGGSGAATAPGTGGTGDGEGASGGGSTGRAAPAESAAPVRGAKAAESAATATAPARGSASDPATAPARGTASGTAGSCRFTAALCALYRHAALTGRVDAAGLALLERSSPSSVGRRIRVPTLLVQGQDDSLFPLGQADEAARAIAANGAPVAVDWTDGGHDGGDQETARVDGRVLSWFDRYLKRERVDTGPAFRVTRQGGVDTTSGREVLDGASASRYPGLDGRRSTRLALSGPPQRVDNPAGGSPPAVSGLPGLGSLDELAGAADGLSVDFPGQYAVFSTRRLRAPLVLTGAPRVRVTVSSNAPGGQAVLFAKLYDVGPDGGRSLPRRLAAPLRITSAEHGRTVTVSLPAVDHVFSAGHRLRLVLAATDLAYSSPAAPAVYRVALADGPAADTGTLTVPTVPGLASGGAALPVWTWALPLLAVPAAAGLLLAGRRRGGGPRGRPIGGRRGGVPGGPGDADVPLEIAGLSKRYRGAADRYAVRELTFRVERGQVVGLLGPNGAGKTTTLRMLMGLVRPDAGRITVFGRPVAPGAPVLSRVGAFVEGAGFLPHLTGRANLDLYWRATGRPAQDAHLAAALEIAGLGEALDRPVRTYSQGMRQRLAIAQAMLGLPDLLILDEPTNGLDPPQIREMRSVVSRYAATGRTVIVSSHLLSEVERGCTHLVVMDRGRLVASGPVGEIVGRAGEIFVGAPDASGQRLAEAARSLLAVPGVPAAEPAEGGLLVRLDGLPVADLLTELLRLGVPVERVGPHQRLEDAFLDLIGGPA